MKISSVRFLFCLALLLPLSLRNQSEGTEFIWPGISYLTNEYPVFLYGISQGREIDPSYGNYSYYCSIYVNLPQSIAIVKANAVVRSYTEIHRSRSGDYCDAWYGYDCSSSSQLRKFQSQVNRFLENKRAPAYAVAPISGTYSNSPTFEYRNYAFKTPMYFFYKDVTATFRVH